MQAIFVEGIAQISGQEMHFAGTGHVAAGFGDHEIAALAAELWRVGGSAERSLGQDWLRAAAILRSSAHAR